LTEAEAPINWYLEFPSFSSDRRLTATNVKIEPM